MVKLNQATKTLASTLDNLVGSEECGGNPNSVLGVVGHFLTSQVLFCLLLYLHALFRSY
jgi:hypothetical protein